MIKRLLNNKLLIISFIVGLAIAVSAGIFLNNKLATVDETVAIAVPKKYIPRYHHIGPEDITMREVEPGDIEDGVVIAAEAVIGKTTLEPLYKGERIRQERITKDDVLKGYDLVCVNVDLARSGGAVPGNLVDVYSVIYESSTAQTIKKLVAKNAVVLNIWDGQGNDLFEKGEVSITKAASEALVKGGSKPPAVIRLAVQPHETKNVVDGAASGSLNIVLVVKSEGGIRKQNDTQKAIKEVTNQHEKTDNGGGKARTDNTKAQNN